MSVPDTQQAISRLMDRYGSQRGAVPTPALVGLQDALEGIALVD